MAKLATNGMACCLEMPPLWLASDAADEALRSEEGMFDPEEDAVPVAEGAPALEAAPPTEVELPRFELPELEFDDMPGPAIPDSDWFNAWFQTF